MAWAPPQAGRDPSEHRVQAAGSEVASAVGPTGGRGGGQESVSPAAQWTPGGARRRRSA